MTNTQVKTPRANKEGVVIGKHKGRIWGAHIRNRNTNKDNDRAETLQ